MSFLLPGAIDLAAKSAGIIPGSPLPVLDAEGLSGIAPLSSDEVTATVPGPESTGTHRDGDSIPTVGVSMPTKAPPRHQLLG